MRRGLFESVWLGLQAFNEATAFNANIGAWNTASMETMSDVCVLCHRLRVRSVVHACLCASLISRVFVCHRPWRIEPAAMHASAVLHSFLEYYCANW
jgi:hypothetical protein